MTLQGPFVVGGGANGRVLHAYPYEYKTILNKVNVIQYGQVMMVGGNAGAAVAVTDAL